MTTMPSWLAQADDLVAAATDAASIQAEIETLSVAKIDLATHLQTLQTLSSAGALGGGSWSTGTTGTPELFDALKTAAKNPSQSAVGHLNRALNSFATTAKAQLLDDWKRYAGDRMGNVSELYQLAAALAGVDSVAAKAATLREVLGRLAQNQDKLPNQAAFDLLAEADKHLAALEEALQPEAVRLFLSAVARGGASLEMLTGDVRSWLKANRAEHSFRITAGPPADS